MTVVAEVRGSPQAMLVGERLALNIMMRMSSIATSTRLLVDEARAVAPAVTVAATRKVTPGFGLFEKRAVCLGGGDPHRWTLNGMVMLKDTHLRLYHGDVTALVLDARARTSFATKIEVEVESLEDALRATRAGADIVMLDNMSPTEIAEVVRALQAVGLRDRVMLEASGGITGTQIADFARSGVDIISTSEITLAPARRVDYSLKIQDSAVTLT
jgi:nicotinate-nucleotide pyrophosphorylase (carboxylating)